MYVGDYYATNAIKIELDNNSSNFVEVTEYELNVPTMVMNLKDFYDQLVKTENGGNCELRVPANVPQHCEGEEDAHIGGEITEQFVAGVAIFDEVTAFCAAGGTLQLQVGSAQVVAGSTTDFFLRFRECVVGGNVLKCV